MKCTKSGKMMIGVAAAVAAVGIGIAVVPRLMEDPKKTVIAAFESVNSDNQITGAEEIFGLREFLENYGKVNCDSVFRIQIDGCSQPGMEMLTGAGMEIRSKADLENWKSRAEMALNYNHMDLAELQFYYGDQVFMAAVPELVDRVFTLKINDSLGGQFEKFSNGGSLSGGIWSGYRAAGRAGAGDDEKAGKWNRKGTA